MPLTDDWHWVTSYFAFYPLVCMAIPWLFTSILTGHPMACLAVAGLAAIAFTWLVTSIARNRDFPLGILIGLVAFWCGTQGLVVAYGLSSTGSIGWF